MKKLLAMLLAALMVLSLCACGSSAPPPKAEDAVIAFSEAMKAFDTAKMGTYLVNNEDIEDEIEAEDEYAALFLDKFKEWAKNIAYEIMSAEEQNEEATVEVKYTFADSTPIISEFIQEYLIQAFSLAFSGGTDEDMDRIAQEILVDKLATVEPSYTESTVKYSLKMVEKEWKINEVPDEVVNVLSANLANAFSAMEDALSLEEESAETAAEEAPQKETSTAAPTPVSSSYVISDETLVDNDVCTFRIVEAYDDSFWGFSLKAYCENKTLDKTLMFSIESASINGYMAEPFWAKEVAAGKKANEQISFGFNDLKSYGITSPDEIKLNLRVYDSDDWLADSFVEESFTIYPTGLSADQIVVPDRKTTATESVVFENDNVAFVILSTGEDSIMGYTLHCYLENNTDKTLMFSWEDVSVNGFMVDPFWAKEVNPGTRCYTDIYFYSGLEENDITEVEEVEYTMRVYDSDDWYGNDLLKDTFVYNP